jgi:fibronectin-binding autotransporter adhesin
MKTFPLFRLLAPRFSLLPTAMALCAASGVNATQAAPFPVIISVNTTFDASSGADDAFPGDSQCETAVGNGVCTLRAAIEESNAHGGADGIFFDIPTNDPGYSNGTWTIKLAKALPSISDSVNISGPGATQLIVFNNIFGLRVFNVTTSGTVNFSGLTISGGDIANDNGAGIQNASTGTVNITNCTLYNNSCLKNLQGGRGGGVYNATTGTMNISSSLFTGNSASEQGGAICNFNGTVTVSNSTFTDNDANNTYTEVDNSLGGGAIYSSGAGRLTVSNSTIAYNTAASGGGIYAGGTITINNSTLNGNFADSSLLGGGGGIFMAGGTLNVVNSTLSGNGVRSFTDSGGGGIFTYLGTLNVTNSTIANNSVFGTRAAGGGGILSLGQAGAVNVKSSIIASNSAEIGPDVVGPFVSAGFNLIGKKDGSTGFSLATDKKGTIASPLNPGLDQKGMRNNGGPTQTIALMSGSVAIDKGTSNGLTGTLTTDQRGFARTVDRPVANATGGDGTDMGAYEFGAQ